jgi:hypothetical protein
MCVQLKESKVNNLVVPRRALPKGLVGPIAAPADEGTRRSDVGRLIGNDFVISLDTPTL